jgi:hypothetical protein
MEMEADNAELTQRLAKLERRIELLERDSTPEPQDPGTGHERDRNDKFWALNGLTARLRAGAGAVLFTGVVPLPTGEEYTWQQRQSIDVLLRSDWSELSPVIAALGHRVRLQLLHLVLTGTRSVAELQADDRLGTSGQLYHHLRQLVAAGWLQQTSKGRYEVPAGRVVPLLVLLATVEH